MSAELFCTSENEADPQETLAGVRSGAGAIAPSSANLGISDAKQLYQFHVEQLASRLPVLAVWLVYHDFNQGIRQSVVYSRQEQPGYDIEIRFGLESKAWLDASLSNLPLGKLVVQPNLQTNFANQFNLPLYAYIYLLGQQGTSPEYLLVWALEPLSASQQTTVEQTAQALHCIQDVLKDSARQQTEIQLLEHVLHRAEHQLRSPLALIGLYAENLRLELIDTSLQEQAILIRDVVDELTANLTDLLYCGQRAKLRVAPHELQTILMESIKGLQPWIDQKQLRVHYPTTSTTLTIDRWQIKQVFDNLLNNAIHFSPSNTSVTCRWHVFQEEVLVEIADEGPGLAPEDLKQAFKPFYSRREGGTGLGLAIAQKIILDHQGSLWVENLPKGGAQFSFTLPRKGF